MQIIVTATDEQWDELTDSRTRVDWKRVADASEFNQYKNADAFFCLSEISSLQNFDFTDKPVLINKVIQTLAEQKAPAHIYRINGWLSFLNRSAWEIAGKPDKQVELLFELLGIKITWVKDEPGFITARILAMIINEAFFAVEDEVSSKLEIDTAMKLGTNYPFGPFEWANQIGLKHISDLLQKLELTDSRYKPSTLLIQEANKNKS